MFAFGGQTKAAATDAAAASKPLPAFGTAGAPKPAVFSFGAKAPETTTATATSTSSDNKAAPVMTFGSAAAASGGFGSQG